MFKKIIFLFFTLAFVFSCATVPVTGRRQLKLIGDSQLMGMSFSQYQSFLQQNQLSRDANQTATVRRVGVRIQKAVESYMQQKGLSSQLQGFQWEFNLVDDNTVNAWCMPGGKVVVYTGILPVCQNEDGLAVVMGHEIAHAIAQHGNERMSQGLLQQLGGVTLSIALADKPQQTQQLWMTAYGVGSQVGMLLPFSRAQESEADKIGLTFSAMAGYDPREAPRFWKRMGAASGGSTTPQFLSTHPSSETRTRNLEEMLPQVMPLYEQAKANKPR